MVGERRSPGVQHGGEPDAGAEVPGVGCDSDQGLGGGFEQQVIDDRLVVIADVGERSRQGEDNVEIGHRQEFGLAVGQPFLGKPDARLIKLLIRARRFNTALVGSDSLPFAALAKREGVSPSYFTRLVRLSYLAPDTPKRSSMGVSRAI